MNSSYPFRISQVVAAADGNMAIGKQGNLLWHLPEDLRFFKNLTWAMPVIMGRKTFASINKPLPGRTNIVLTRSKDAINEKVTIASSLEKSLEHAGTLETGEVFIIGGGEIYERFMPVTDRIYLTRVFTSINDADTFYPSFDTSTWQLVHAHRKEADERNAFAMQFETWERLK